MDILGIQWENIKQNIQLEYDITDIAFNIWVKPLKYGKREDKLVTILIPNSSPEMLNYIEKNYKDPNFSLEDLARKLFYAPSYISRIFKETTL